MAQRKEMHTRSENISLGGILLTSTSLIPEGSAVEVSIGVEHLPDPGILLSAHGKVLRVHPKDTGDFSVAIKLDGGFGLPISATGSPSPPKASHSTEKKPASPGLLKTDWPKNRTLSNRGMHFGLAWHTET
jgi:hypothetical protein